MVNIFAIYANIDSDTVDVSVGNATDKRIINVDTPIDPTDAANKAYVDAATPAAPTLASVLDAGNTTDGYDVYITQLSNIIGETDTRGGDVNLIGGVGVSLDGGDVVFTGGTPGTNRKGGNIIGQSGNADGTGNGGDVSFTASNSTSTAGSVGGNIRLYGSSGIATNDAGVIEILGGTSSTGAAGIINITGGDTADGTAGDVNISGGNVPDTAANLGSAGNVNITGGNALDSNASLNGEVVIVGGSSATSGALLEGGLVTIKGGAGELSSTAGSVLVSGGKAGPSGQGGDVSIVGSPGASGAASDGIIELVISNTGLSPGLINFSTGTKPFFSFYNIASTSYMLFKSAVSDTKFEYENTTNTNGNIISIIGQTSTDLIGGPIIITAGLGDTDGGNLSLTAGAANTGTGGTLNIVGGTSVSGAAGDIYLTTQTGTTNGSIIVDGNGTIIFEEVADHSRVLNAGEGGLWVRNDSPNTLIFTDDANTDHDLLAGGGGGGGTAIDVYVTGLAAAGSVSTTVYTISASNQSVAVRCEVVGRGGTESAAYEIFGLFEDTAGTLAQVGSTQVLSQIEDSAGWNATFVVSGSNVQVTTTNGSGSSADLHIIGVAFEQT